MRRYLLIFCCLMFAHTVCAERIEVYPSQNLSQGDVFQIRLPLRKGEAVQRIDFDGATVPFYVKNRTVRALRGLPLSAKTGVRLITIYLKNGSLLNEAVTVSAKEKPVHESPAIPESLGGNTPAAEVALVSTLEKENQALRNLFTQKKALWTLPFVSPVINPEVTDTFGYSRAGAATTITHKGTDYRANEKTKVRAMNRGVVRLVRNFKTYGNAIVIDHGLGVMTLYLHLSKVSVAEGQLLKRGQTIGNAGATGYATGPHLHLSVRVNEASIDPEKFLALVGE